MRADRGFVLVSSVFVRVFMIRLFVRVRCIQFAGGRNSFEVYFVFIRILYLGIWACWFRFCLLLQTNREVLMCQFVGRLKFGAPFELPEVFANH